MILYLDTSALVKLFLDELDSDLVRRGVARADFRGCHLIGYAEACAALGRQKRIARLAESVLSTQLAGLTRTWAQLDVIEPNWPQIRRAGELAVRLNLRGYDSVHLAAVEALWLEAGAGSDVRFAVFDASLAAAARTLGIAILER